MKGPQGSLTPFLSPLPGGNGSTSPTYTSTANLSLQLQATVKFHGVFTSRWVSLAFAPEKSFRRDHRGDSGNLVAPFMQAVIETARHFATLREL